MLPLTITDEAKQDLDSIKNAGHVQEWARIVAFLEQAVSDGRITRTLLDHGFRNEIYSVSRFVEQWNAGRDLWRIRVLDLPRRCEQYRVIYGYDITGRHFYVLGVPHRDFNYDAQDPRTIRILRAYEEYIG